jgi:hypothetical protein
MSEIVRPAEQRKAHCRRCRGERNCNVRGCYIEPPGSGIVRWERAWYILECRGCDLVFVQTVWPPNTQIDEEQYIEYWPALAKREAPEWVETMWRKRSLWSISLALREIYRALDNDLPRLAAIGVRMIFDMAAELLQIEERLTFKQKLEALQSKGHIKPSDMAPLDILVEAGNASVHRGWIPSADDLKCIGTFYL